METGLSNLDQRLGPYPLVHPTEYPPPAYEKGVVTGQPYELTVNGGWHPYIEIEPAFHTEGLAH